MSERNRRRLWSSRSWEKFMKTISSPTQVKLWLIFIGIPLILWSLKPVVGRHYTSPWDDYLLCALLVFVLTLIGVGASLWIYGSRMSEDQRCSRIIILQTIPVWILAVTYVLMGIGIELLRNAPDSFWRIVRG